jgi:hypothetical protein
MDVWSCAWHLHSMDSYPTAANMDYEGLRHENPQCAWPAAVQARETSQQAQGPRAHRTRQTRRVFLPVSTGLSHMAGHGDDGAPVGHGYRLQRGQTTNHRSAPSLRPPCRTFLSTCFPACLCARLSSSPCWFVCGQGGVQQRPTRSVSQVAAHSKGGEGSATRRFAASGSCDRIFVVVLRRCKASGGGK